MTLKRFALFSVSLLCLAATLAIGLHIGQMNAVADQSAQTVFTGIAVGSGTIYAITSNGDIYMYGPLFDPVWELQSNILRAIELRQKSRKAR